MDKELLKSYLKDGLSTREIEKIANLDHRTISYWIQKHDLSEESAFKKLPPYKFDKIDTKEKAYALGFILADGAISNSMVEVSVALSDKCALDMVASTVNANVQTDARLDVESRRFPRARMMRKIGDITKFTGGEKKQDRHYPRIREDLEKYMIQGFFDADGCITWGRRKDKNRIWQKISFTSQFKMLYGVQQYLINKVGISSSIKPKSGENCFVLEFSNKEDVLKFLSHLYDNNTYIVLARKYLKAKALRLELEENGESIAI